MSLDTTSYIDVIPNILGRSADPGLAGVIPAYNFIHAD
jgi:hypothetical protein